ncbi:zinc finger protein 268-like [Topomyia yanbarensis]|uniref:zinc finger protein 268-like n=1 Tax=Topomyia yanbarensis TaxID=2498891 RepID=UPI00273ABD47|nr:zinc finger protein 268-like [Topomyia yanbarensis]
MSETVVETAVSTEDDPSLRDFVSEEDGLVVRLNDDGIETICCTFCEKPYRSKQQCKRHITVVHWKFDTQPEIKKEKVEELYKCEHCDSIFKSRKSLAAHEKTHVPKNENRYQCQTCPAGFRTLARYKQHLNQHFGTKRNYDTLPCEQCDAVFKSREGRRVHMILKHSAGQTYKCKECPMIFARKGNLRLHMTTHGVRPHVCSICGRSYARIETLRTHEQSCATGNKGLCCDECGQRFRKQELLDKHIQQGHPEKEYQCNYCGQSFESKRALSHHVRVHEGKFRCAHCTLQFVTEKALQNHEKGRHWEILGVERVIGKQGQRKDRADRPKEPKVRVRRNKFNPFLGLEHLVEELNGKEDDDKPNVLDEPCVTSSNSMVQGNGDCLMSNLEDIVRSLDDLNSVHAVAAVFEDTDDKLEEDTDNTANSLITDEVINRKNGLLECEQTKIELTAYSANDENIQQQISDLEENGNFTGNNSVDGDDNDNSSSDCNDDDDASSNDSDPDWTNEANEQDCSTDIELKFNPVTAGSDSSGVSNPEIQAKRKYNRKPAEKKSKVKKSYEKRFTCKDCDKSFAHRYWLNGHRERVHGVRNEDPMPPKKLRIHFCSKCNKTFSDWRNLVYHCKHIHKLTINESEVESCKSCQKRFINATELEMHSCFKGSYVNRTPFYKCDLCDKQYYSQHGLDCHRSVHPEYHKYNCDVCQKPFANIKDMNYHKKRVHVEASFTCDVCGKAFKVQAQLKLHIQIHQQLKGYQCEFCGKSFAQRNGMTAHLRISHPEQLGEEALAEREMTCKICQKKLKGKICLKLHMKTHTDERNYQCSYCDKKFIAKQDKFRHEQTHTKEYRFKCRFCGKGSTRRKLILLHEAREHNYTTSESLGPSHKCSVCEREFSTPSARQIHESLHSDALPVPCTQCDRRFKNVKYMKYHVKAHHEIKNLIASKPKGASKPPQPSGEQQQNSLILADVDLNNANSDNNYSDIVMYSTYTLAQPHGIDILV